MKCIINGQVAEVDNIDSKWYGTDYFYEIIRIIEGKSLFLKEHYERLKNGIGQFNERDLTNSIDKLIKTVDSSISQNIYLSIHKENKECMMFFNPSFYPPKSWYQKGIWVPLIEVEREDSNNKIFREDYKKRVKEELEAKKAFEGLLISSGTIKEGSRSNIFFIKNNTLYTPYTSKVLPGITRRKVCEACKRNEIIIVETDIYIQDLEQYEGVFITGTSLDLLPISGIDNLKFDTVNNRIFKVLFNKYNLLKEFDLNK